MARYQYDPDGGRGEQMPGPNPPSDDNRGNGPTRRRHSGTNDDPVTKKKKKKQKPQQQPQPKPRPENKRKKSGTNSDKVSSRPNLSPAQRRRAQAEAAAAVRRAAYEERAATIAAATRKWQRSVTETPTNLGNQNIFSKVAEIRQAAAAAAEAQRAKIAEAKKAAEAAERQMQMAQDAKERAIQEANLRAARAASMTAYAELLKKNQEAKRREAWTVAIEERRAAIQRMMGGDGQQKVALKPRKPLAQQPQQGMPGQWAGYKGMLGPTPKPVEPKPEPKTTGQGVSARVKKYDKKDPHTGKELEKELNLLGDVQKTSNGGDFDVQAYNDTVQAYVDYTDALSTRVEKRIARLNAIEKEWKNAKTPQEKRRLANQFNKLANDRAFKADLNEAKRVFGDPNKKKEGSAAAFGRRAQEISNEQNAYMQRQMYGDNQFTWLTQRAYQDALAEVDKNRGYVTETGPDGKTVTRQRTLEEEITYRQTQQRIASQQAAAAHAKVQQRQLQQIQQDPAAMAVSQLLYSKNAKPEDVSSGEWQHVANGYVDELMANWERAHPNPVVNLNNQLHSGLPDQIPYYLADGSGQMDLMTRPPGMSDKDWGERVQMLRQKGLVDEQQYNEFMSGGRLTQPEGQQKSDEWGKQKQAYENQVRKYLNAPDNGLLGDIFRLPIVEGLVNILGSAWGAVGARHQQRAAELGGVPGRGPSGLLDALSEAWLFLERVTYSNTAVGGVARDVQKGQDDAQARADAGNLVPMTGIGASPDEGGLGIIGLPIDIINSILGGDVVDVSPEAKIQAAEFLKLQAEATKSGDVWQYLRFLNSEIPQNPIRFGPGAPIWNIGGQVLVDPSNYVPLNLLSYAARSRHALEMSGRVAAKGEGVLARLSTIAEKSAVGVHSFVNVSEEFLKARANLISDVSELTGMKASAAKAKLGEALAGLDAEAEKSAQVRKVLDALGLTQRQIEGTQLANLIEAAVTEHAKNLGVDLITRADEIAERAAKEKAVAAQRAAERAARAEAARKAAELRIATVEGVIKRVEEDIAVVRTNVAEELSKRAGEVAAMARRGEIAAAEKAAADLAAAAKKAAEEAADVAKVEAKRVADEAAAAERAAAEVAAKKAADDVAAAAREAAATPAKKRVKAKKAEKKKKTEQRVADKMTNTPPKRVAEPRNPVPPVERVTPDARSAHVGGILQRASDDLAKYKRLRSAVSDGTPEAARADKAIETLTRVVAKARDELAGLAPVDEVPAIRAPQPKGRAYVPGNDDVGSMDDAVRSLERDAIREIRAEAEPVRSDDFEIAWHPDSEDRFSAEADALRTDMASKNPAVAADARQRLAQMAHDERQQRYMIESGGRRGVSLTPAQYIISAGAYTRSASMTVQYLAEVVGRIQDALRLSKGKGGLAKKQESIKVVIDGEGTKVVDEFKSAASREIDERANLRVEEIRDEKGNLIDRQVHRVVDGAPVDIPVASQIDLGEQATLFLQTDAISEFYNPLTRSSGHRFKDPRWTKFVEKLTPSDFIAFILSEAAEFLTMNKAAKGPWAFRQSTQGIFELFHATYLSFPEKMPALHDIAVKMALRPSEFGLADDIESVMLARLWLLMESRAGMPIALPFDVAERLVAEIAPRFDMIPPMTLAMFPGPYVTNAATTRFRLPPAIERLRDANSPFYALPKPSWKGDGPFHGDNRIVQKLFAAGNSTFRQYAQTATALLTHAVTTHGQYMKARKFRAQVLENGLHRALKNEVMKRKNLLGALDESPFVRELYDTYAEIYKRKRPGSPPLPFEAFLRQLKAEYAKADKYFPGKRISTDQERNFVDYGLIGSFSGSDRNYIQKPLREAFETLHTRGRVAMSSPGGEIMMFLTHNLQYPGAYLAGKYLPRVDRFVRRMETFGMGREAGLMVADMFDDQLGMFLRKAGEHTLNAETEDAARALAREFLNMPEGRFWTKVGKAPSEDQMVSTWKTHSRANMAQEVSADLGHGNDDLILDVEDAGPRSDEFVAHDMDEVSDVFPRANLKDVLDEHSEIVEKVMSIRGPHRILRLDERELGELADLLARLSRAGTTPALRREALAYRASLWRLIPRKYRNALYETYHVWVNKAIADFIETQRFVTPQAAPTPIGRQADRLLPSTHSDFSVDTKPSGFTGNPEAGPDPEGLFRKPGSVPPRTDLEPVDGYPSAPRPVAPEAPVAPAPPVRPAAPEPVFENAPPPREPEPPRTAPEPDPQGEIGMIDDSQAAYEAKRLEMLMRLGQKTDEQFFTDYREALYMRRRKVAFGSPEYEALNEEIRKVNRIIRDTRRVVSAKRNIQIVPGKARAKHADEVVKEFGDEAGVMFPERMVAYFAQTAEQVKVEIARAVHRKVRTAKVQSGKKPRKWWDAHDVSRWGELNKLVSDAVAEVNGYRAGAIRAKGATSKRRPKGALIPKWTDRNAAILIAKKRALAEWQAKTGERIPIWQYDLMRGVLEPATAPGRRAYLILKKGARTEEEFLAVRARLAKEEAKKTLWHTAYENPDMLPEDVYKKFLDDWTDNGELRHKEQVVTGFQQHILKKYFEHLTGASYDDEFASAQALSAHGTRPPFDKRYDFKAHQVRIGAWSPRSRDAIDTGKAAWSYDDQVEFFMANYRALPDWLSDPRIADGSAFSDHRTFMKVMKENGTFDSQALVEARLSKADTKQTAHTLAFGDPAKGIEPRRDLADQRRIAAQTWGSRVVDSHGNFISMPWLMTPTEMTAYVKSGVRDDFGNLIHREQELQDLQAAIGRVIDRKFPAFMQAVVDQTGVLTYSDIIEFSYEVTQELMRTKSWKSFWRRDLIARGLDAWSMVWRAQVMLQMGFVTSNIIDNPTKGLLFSLNRRDIMEAGSTRGRAAIPNLEAIGMGEYTTLMYAGNRRGLRERIADAREIGELGPGARDVANGVLETLANGLAPIAGNVENAVKLRMAQDLYGGLWNKFRDTVLKDLDDDVADLAIKREIARELNSIFPTLKNAGPIERLLNQVSPFISYNFKNKVVWIREVAKHPGLLLKIRNAQIWLEKYNLEKWQAEHPGEALPPNWDKLKHQFPLGTFFGEPYWFDLGIFSDAGRGLSLLYAGDKTLADHLYNIFRPFSAMQISTFREVANSIGFNVPGLTTTYKWVPTLDSDGNPTGKYTQVEMPIGTEWGADHLTWGDFFWPASIVGEIGNAIKTGKIEPKNVIQLFARLTFFKEFGTVDHYAAWNMVYHTLLDADPAAAERFLLTPEGRQLKEWWHARGMLPKSHYVDPLLFENMKDIDPKTLRAAFIASQPPDFMKRVKEGYGALHAMEDYYDKRMSTVEYGSAEWKRMKLERKAAALAIYKDYPELIDYENTGLTNAQWAERQQKWAVDEAEDTFYNLFGEWPKREDFKNDKAYEKARQEFIQARKDYLAANPGVANRINATYDSLRATEQRVRATWNRAIDRIARRQKRIDALREADKFGSELDRLYFLNDLDNQMLEREGIAVIFDKNTTTMIGGTLVSRTAARIARIMDFEGQREASMNPVERKKYNKEREYGRRMRMVIDRAKAGGKFDPAVFYRIMQRNPDLREQWFDHNPGKREQWAQNDAYMGFWARFHRLAKAGRWDAAWDTFDRAPAWIRERYYANNPGKRAEQEKGGKYFGYMSRWAQLLDGKNLQKAWDYFDSLPEWVKDEYFSRHPDSKMRGGAHGSALSDSQFKQYSKMMGKWVSLAKSGNDAAADAYFNSLPAWAKNFYKSRHHGGGKGSGLSDSQFSEYTKMMGKWVDLLKTKGKDAADDYFRSLPGWAQDFYAKRHPDKALLRESDAQLRKMAMFFLADEAHQNAMIAKDPSILKWLNENASGTQRINAIMYLYSSLPDDAWIKRTFREKYPEVFSPEAKGERAIQGVLDKLAANPKYQPGFLVALQAVWDEVAEAQKHQLAPPKQMEMERPKRRRKSHRRRSAKEVSESDSFSPREST